MPHKLTNRTKKHKKYTPKTNRALTKTRTHVWLVIDHETGEISAHRRHKPAFYSIFGTKIDHEGYKEPSLREELARLHHNTGTNQCRLYKRVGSDKWDIEILRLRIV